MTRRIAPGARKPGLLRVAAALAALSCAVPPARAAAQADGVDFETAARAATRLSPSAFPGLPTRVVDALRASGCAVPQYRFDGDTLANNVIQGEFARAGQTDFAALCSRKGRTSVHVVWGGPTRCADETKTGADVDAMVGAGDELVYARQIRPVGREEAATFAWLRASGLSGIEHDAILHSVGEYQSSVLYCRDGEWKAMEPEVIT